MLCVHFPCMSVEDRKKGTFYRYRHSPSAYQEYVNRPPNQQQHGEEKRKENDTDKIIKHGRRICIICNVYMYIQYLPR